MPVPDEKNCSHSNTMLTMHGCMRCVGEAAATTVVAKWSTILENMPAAERVSRAPEIVSLMQEQVVEETSRIL